MLNYQRPSNQGDAIAGALVHVEQPFGNLGTNIPDALLAELNIRADKKQKVWVSVSNQNINNGQSVFEQLLPFMPSFGFVAVGEPLLYVDSLNTVGLAVANGNFSSTYSVGAGDDWSITISPAAPER